MQARARDLFYGLWTTDVFMQRVEANADWSLFCPNEAPGLADCWGEEHAALYIRYEREGRAKRTIKAQQLWFAILEAQASCHCDSKRLEAPIALCCSHMPSNAVLVQVETGNPYMLFKDSCNRKSNQQNLGTIKCSNLCTEIIEFTSPDETAVCNLASIALPRYVREKDSASPSGRPKLSGSLNAPNRYCCPLYTACRSRCTLADLINQRVF